MSIGNNIKRLRIQRGLTQEELGSLTGTSAAGIRQYELGIRNPKSDKLTAIATALGVNPEVLIDYPATEDFAMHQIFHMIRNFDGFFDREGNLRFNGLDLTRFRKQFEIYQKELADAEKIQNPQARLYAMEDALDKFNYWMDIYPRCISANHGYDFEKDFKEYHKLKISKRN